MTAGVSSHSLTSLVFDLDGTLVDSAGDVTHAINILLRELELGQVAQHDVVPLLGEGASALIGNVLTLVGRPARDPQVVAQHTKRYLQLYAEDPVRRSHLYPGVAETLVKLDEGGIKLGVCTNKTERLAREVLRGLGVLAHFQSVVGADRLAVQKPHPEPLLTTVRELTGDLRTSVFIGDSAIDVACAEHAEVPCYLVPWAAPSLPQPRLRDFADLLALASAPSISTWQGGASP